MIVILLINKIISLFIMMFLGFLIVKLGALKSTDSKVLSILTINLFLPFVIFSSFLVEFSKEVQDGVILSFVAGAVVNLLLIVIVDLMSRFFHFSREERTSMIYTNSTNLIIPLVTYILGKEWVIFSIGYLSVQLFLMWSHGKIVLCGEKTIDIKKIVTNPNMIAIFLGVIAFALHLRLPAPIEDAFESIGGVVGPAAMLTTGMLMAGMDLKKMLSNIRLWMIVGIRLVILPIIMLLILKYSGLASMAANGTGVLLITLLAASAPSASTITQMAQVYGQDADYTSAINVASILLCIVTMPICVILYQM